MPVPISSDFVPASVAPAGAELVEGWRGTAAPRSLGTGSVPGFDARIASNSAAMINTAQYVPSAKDVAYPRDGGFVMRLLIIEDDRDAADYLVKAFREVGHIADLAADGEEGLAQALDGQYDVLIVDRMLPKLDGLSVIGTLRGKIDKGFTQALLHTVRGAGYMIREGK